jgi:hypothetical protein
MSDIRLPVQGSDFFAEQTIAQFVIPAGAGATFSAANNIGTITFNAAHGLTLNPAANVPPNYYISFGGSTSGLTGTGVLVGNVFRILTIPSTTAITIYTTITAATVTSLTGIPVFYPWLQPSQQSGFVAGPTQTISTVVTPFAPGYLQAAAFNFSLGANCVIQYCPAQNAYILDQVTTTALGGTPGTAPTYRTIAAASTANQMWIVPPNMGIFASGTTANSFFSQIQ